MTYLPLPENTPMIGGIFLSAPKDLLQNHRNWAVGLARGVAKAHIFIQENPEAAAYVYSQMFPEALPKGMDLQDQIKAVMVPVAWLTGAKAAVPSARSPVLSRRCGKPCRI